MALSHGNRGRRPSNAFSPVVREKVGIEGALPVAHTLMASMSPGSSLPNRAYTSS